MENELAFPVLSDVYVRTNLDARFLLQIQQGTSADAVMEVLNALQSADAHGVPHTCAKLCTSTDQTVNGFMLAPGYCLLGVCCAGELPGPRRCTTQAAILRRKHWAHPTPASRFLCHGGEPENHAALVQSAVAEYAFVQVHDILARHRSTAQ